MTNHTGRPSDFEDYWDEVDRLLAAVPANPEVDLLPLRSNEVCDTYALRITSVGPYRIFGYFSVPIGNGPFPGLLLMPGYGSVNQIPEYNDRMRYVTLQIMHRGQRLADQPYAAAYPGLLTDGIADSRSYVFRHIVADCLRSAEFLLSRPEVDRERTAVTGNDLALIVAARRPRFSVVQAGNLMFYRFMEACRRTEAYPLEEVNDYLRTYPEHEAAVAQTLAYIDPVHHVSAITAMTSISVDDPGSVGGEAWLERLITSIGGPLVRYQLTHEGGTDNDALDAWLADSLGEQPMTSFRESALRSTA